MCRFEVRALAGALLLWGVSATAAAPWHALGRAVAPEEVASWDIDVLPDGTGLPPGQGSVAEGQVIYDAQCASCHGTFGESTDFIALTGGIGSLASDTPQRTVGSKLNYATTLWDYTFRAMPFNNSKTLAVNEVYAVTAYVLNLNEIVPAEAILDEKTLPKVQMPNQAGYTLDHGLTRVDGEPDIKNVACMKDCAPSTVTVSSELPPGFTAQMYGDIRTHFRQLAVPNPLALGIVAVAPATPGAQELARSHGCLACHGVEQALVGPAFVDIARRYAQNAEAARNLALKTRQGGSGVWGSALMPPQTQIPEADLMTLLGWILAGAKNE